MRSGSPLRTTASRPPLRVVDVSDRDAPLGTGALDQVEVHAELLCLAQRRRRRVVLVGLLLFAPLPDLDRLARRGQSELLRLLRGGLLDLLDDVLGRELGDVPRSRGG